MHRPRLLILDEPTGGLDPLNQQTFNDIVHEAHGGGATVFLSSHILPEVEHLCDRVGIIREGKLITVDQVAALQGLEAARRGGDLPRSPASPDWFAALPGVREATPAERRAHPAPDRPGRPARHPAGRGEPRRDQPRLARAEPGGNLPALLHSDGQPPTAADRPLSAASQSVVGLRPTHERTNAQTTPLIPGGTHVPLDLHQNPARLSRLAILIWGFGLALIVYAYFPLSTSTIVKGNPEEVQRLAESQRFFAEPVAITTPAGYVTWKVIASLPLILGIWAARAGARLGRFAEERGTLDIVLSTPQSRGRVLGEGIAALVAATILIGVLIGVGSLIGEASADVTVDPVGALLTGVNVSLMSLAFGTLALFMAQFLTSAGAATGFACAVMVVAWILDGTGRISPDLAWVGRLSPYHLFTLSKPLIASYGTNYGALIALVALAAIFGAVSIPLFARRDLGASAWPRRGTARRGAARRSSPGRWVTSRCAGSGCARCGPAHRPWSGG